MNCVLPKMHHPACYYLSVGKKPLSSCLSLSDLLRDKRCCPEAPPPSNLCSSIIRRQDFLYLCLYERPPHIVNFTVQIQTCKRSCHTRRQLLEQSRYVDSADEHGCRSISTVPAGSMETEFPGYRYLTGVCQYGECIGRLIRSGYRLYSYRVLTRSLG